MNKYLKILAVILGSFSIVSCAGHKLKQQCKNTNWFEYAQNVSKQTKYLEEDSFVQQCRKAEAIDEQNLDRGFKLGREKMCNYNEIEGRGRRGEVVYLDFCDALSGSKAKNAYHEGLQSYCKEENAYQLGRKGEIYNQVCGPYGERKFLEKYNKGRKDYLVNALADMKTKQGELEKENKTLAAQESAALKALQSGGGDKLKASNEFTKAQGLRHQNEAKTQALLNKISKFETDLEKLMEPTPK